MSIRKHLARELQRYRQENHLSIQALADRLKLPKSSVESYLNGTGNPRADTLELISRRTGIPLSRLVSGPSPEQEWAETILQVVKALSSLPFERLQNMSYHLQMLAALLAKEVHI